MEKTGRIEKIGYAVVSMLRKYFYYYYIYIFGAATSNLQMSHPHHEGWPAYPCPKLHDLCKSLLISSSVKI